MERMKELQEKKPNFLSVTSMKINDLQHIIQPNKKYVNRIAQRYNNKRKTNN